MPRTIPRPEHVVRDHFEKRVHPLPGIPELIVVGRASVRSGSRLETQQHEGLELCYIERGNESWWVGGEIHPLRGGDMLVIPPNEPHGPVDETIHPCTQYWLQVILPRRLPRRWLGLGDRDAKVIHRELAALPRRRFQAPATIARFWERIFDALQRNDELTAATVRTNLAALLLEAIEFSRRAAQQQPESVLVTEASKLMAKNLAHPLPIPKIAELVGWSTSQLKRQFRASTGLPPAEFYLRLRLAAARERIVNSKQSLASIALDFGFSSSQYLTTCFQRVLGSTPSTLRRKSRTASASK